MTKTRKIAVGAALSVLVLAGAGWWLLSGDEANIPFAEVTGTHPKLEEDFDSETFPTISVAKPVGWDAGAAPLAAQGLTVTRFAEGLDHPRTMITLPNGDVVVALTNAPASSNPGGIVGWVMSLLMKRAGASAPAPNQLVLLRDADGDGKAEQKFTLREGLSSPSGLAYGDGHLYVANHDALLSFAFQPGQTKLEGEPQKLMDLPAAGNHWMRNIELSPDGVNLYIAVGSASNIGENGMDVEKGRAAIWEYDLKARSRRQYAAGLRNPNGMGWNPATGELWTTVNERDMLGSDLVPDYLTNVPVGAQYGWPWVYWRNKVDRRVADPMPQFLTEYSRRPEYALGPHVAALGLLFTQEGHRMGDAFANGAFIAQHGSWNRKPKSGYDVVFVKFDERGNPVDKPVPVLTGFLTGDGATHGRPTWLSWDKQGALLVSDDTAGIIWRVIAPNAKPAAKPEAVKSTPLPPQRELKGGNPAEAFKQDYIQED
jgi:YD repeat-containing protein